jgi:sulfide:quinone oxidoreductase
MAHIAIMGAGLGGVACAYEMKKRVGKANRVTLIGSSGFFEFTPSNPWIAVGWRTAPQTRVDLAKPLADKGIEWIAKMVQAIDAPASRLTLADGATVDYDYLVITTGPKLSFEEVPGLGPKGHTLSVCTHAHAREAWDRYQSFVESPGPIIVGAAP